MAKLSRENTGLSLLQNNPPREQLLEKMRGKLASTPSVAKVETERKREVRKRATATWTVRALVLLGFCAINYFLIGNRDVISAKLHKPAVPRLPVPSESFSPDEKALYYAFALFDYPRLKEKYGVAGFYAVDQADTKRRIEALLPEVKPQTLGVISGYMPVAFRSPGEASR